MPGPRKLAVTFTLCVSTCAGEYLLCACFLLAGTETWGTAADFLLTADVPVLPCRISPQVKQLALPTNSAADWKVFCFGNKSQSRHGLPSTGQRPSASLLVSLSAVIHHRPAHAFNSNLVHVDMHCSYPCMFGLALLMLSGCHLQWQEL